MIRILLDECLPRRLKWELVRWEVLTVSERGWSGMKNGELLQAADNEFDLFVTIDQGLKYQQNLGTLSLSLIVLSARSNRFEDLVPLVPELREALEKRSPGKVVRIQHSAEK